MTKDDLVKLALIPTTVKIFRCLNGYNGSPVPFNCQRAIFESLDNLTMGVGEILKYIQMKEEKANNEKNRNNRDKKKKRGKLVSKS